jgi:hypothetical protein
MAIRLESRLTCPACGAVSGAIMPTDFCQVVYDCPNCGAVLKPLSGRCCVFCSFGDTPCPPDQLAAAAIDADLGARGRSGGMEHVTDDAT